MSDETSPKGDREGDQGSKGGDGISLRQRLHAATGDRDAEAQALADETDDDISVSDAKVAVQLARGERGREAPDLGHDIATPTDAEAVKESRHPEDAGRSGGSSS